LEKAGIITVGDLMRAEPDALAGVIRTRQVAAETIRQWQQEATLVCRVPDLRGHESQLLVAAGIHSPEELAASGPQELLERLVAAATGESGKKIQGQQPPGLEEVARWIQRAGQSRQLQTA
jgi:hypothetical protein